MDNFCYCLFYDNKKRNGGKTLIIRERKKDFIFIEQHHHATISGKLYTFLKDEYVPQSPWGKAIEYAINHHDRGWIPFDQTPFWNDKEQVPYDFTHFPAAPKTVLYKTGIDQVEEYSAYAALLCSKHYSLFMERHSDSYSKKFVEEERERRQRIITSVPDFDEEMFADHYKILQFFDNLSLFICLNEPGRNEHPYFLKGIPLPASFGGNTLQLHWTSAEEIQLYPKIFHSKVRLELQQKRMIKKDILQNGLQKTYENANFEKVYYTVR